MVMSVYETSWEYGKEVKGDQKMNEVADLLEELYDYGWTLDEFGVDDEGDVEHYILKNYECMIHVWMDSVEDHENDFITVTSISTAEHSSYTFLRYEIECVHKFINAVTSIHMLENERVVQMMKKLKEKDKLSAKAWEEE